MSELRKNNITIYDLYCEYKSFIRYTAISGIVTLIDIGISRISEFFLSLIFSNTIGVLTGFTVQYLLTSRFVYSSRNKRTFAIFLGTFITGLILANIIVFICRTYMFPNDDSFLAFIVSKGFSIVIPFFYMYFTRKHFIKPGDSFKKD